MSIAKLLFKPSEKEIAKFSKSYYLQLDFYPFSPHIITCLFQKNKENTIMTSSTFELISMVPLLKAAEKATLEGKPAAVGAFNVNFYTQALGILEGLRNADAPGIIQASKGANAFQGGPDKIATMLINAMKIKMSRQSEPGANTLNRQGYLLA